MKDTLQEVKMEIPSLLELIISNRGGADYTMHPLSRGVIGDTTDCTDMEIVEYFNILKNMKVTDDPATLVISDMYWLESGGCAGDEIFPVVMTAQLLPPGDRFYITIDEKNGREEFIFELPGAKEK